MGNDFHGRERRNKDEQDGQGGEFHFVTAAAGLANLFTANHFTNGLVDFCLPELAHVAAFFVVGDLVWEVGAEPVEVFIAEEEVVAGEDEVEAFGSGGACLALAEVAGVRESCGGDGLLSKVGGKNFGEIIVPAEGVDALI